VKAHAAGKNGITNGMVRLFADNPDGGGAIGLHYAVYRELLLDRH
jgi:hypothetical protein